MAGSSRVILSSSSTRKRGHRNGTLKAFDIVAQGKRVAPHPGNPWLEMRFEWDENKALRNFGKHAVEFEEAATVFADPLFLIFADDDHSSIELRYVIMARSSAGRLLVVAYTPRGEVIRLISAREATRGERKRYEEEA